MRDILFFLIAVALLAALVLPQVMMSKQMEPVNVLLQEEPVKGSADARVTIVEFSDFLCPYCTGFSINTFPKIDEKYIETGKVKLIFRNFPVHAGAWAAAEASECAHEQGRFWDYHDRLYAAGRESFTGKYLKQLAQELKLDSETFNDCFDTDRYDEEIKDDLRVGRRLGVEGTPTFFINGREVMGSRPFETFEEIIEEELAKEQEG